MKLVTNPQTEVGDQSSYLTTIGPGHSIASLSPDPTGIIGSIYVDTMQWLLRSLSMYTPTALTLDTNKYQYPRATFEFRMLGMESSPELKAVFDSCDSFDLDCVPFFGVLIKCEDPELATLEAGDNKPAKFVQIEDMFKFCERLHRECIHMPSDTNSIWSFASSGLVQLHICMQPISPEFEPPSFSDWFTSLLSQGDSKEINGVKAMLDTLLTAFNRELATS